MILHKFVDNFVFSISEINFLNDYINDKSN
jgi:hypothetical protein